MLQRRSAGTTSDQPIAPYDPYGPGVDQRAPSDFDVIMDEPSIDKIARDAEPHHAPLVDGFSSWAIENEDDKRNRSKLFRDLGYKK